MDDSNEEDKLGAIETLKIFCILMHSRHPKVIEYVNFILKNTKLENIEDLHIEVQDIKDKFKRYILKYFVYVYLCHTVIMPLTSNITWRIYKHEDAEFNGKFLMTHSGRIAHQLSRLQFFLHIHSFKDYVG